MVERKAYISEDLEELYVPVSEEPSWRVAHSLASSQANELRLLHEDRVRTKYIGKRDVRLHDHDDWEGCEECPAVPVWVFQTYDG
jgi:hypothetical protein